MSSVNSTNVYGFNRLCSDVEQALNIAGAVAGVNFFSGAVRIFGGASQLVAATVFSTIGFAGISVQPKNSLCKYAVDNSPEHMLHGLLNIVRGAFEFSLGWTGAPYFYQRHTGNNFKPAYRYTGTF
jgi:hypothetical protein